MPDRGAMRRPVSRRRLGHPGIGCRASRSVEQRPPRGHTRNHGWVHGRRSTVSTGPALALRRARYALWKNPENLTDRQRVKLAWIAQTDPRLYRAYLLKEGLRTVFNLPADQAGEALDRWVTWARRCRIESFVRLQRRITGH